MNVISLVFSPSRYIPLQLPSAINELTPHVGSVAFFQVHRVSFIEFGAFLLRDLGSPRVSKKIYRFPKGQDKNSASVPVPTLRIILHLK